MSMRRTLSFGTNVLAASSVGVPVTGSMGVGASPSGLATAVLLLAGALVLGCASAADLGSAFLPSHNQRPRATMPASNSSVMRLPAAEPRERRDEGMNASPR